MNDSVVRSHSSANKIPNDNTAADIVGVAEPRPVVVVLGMHRSGTSLCSHILSILGVDMTDTILPPGAASLGADNQRGHWERWEIVEFHDRILSFFNRSYFTPFHDLPLPIAWWTDSRVVAVRREIIEFLETRMGRGLFGFKDPRTVRLMPMWHQIIREVRLVPKIVFCLRNPAQVARSLTARDRIDTDTAEYRWFSYVADFFRYTKDYDICTVEYETWFEDPTTNLYKLFDFLQLGWSQSEFDLDLTISDVVDQTLRHDDPRRCEAGQPLARSLYKLARRASEEPTAREQIQLIVSQFISFQQFHRPLQRAFENAATLAARLPQIEQDAAVLRAGLSERGPMIDEANRRASLAEEQRSASAAESEALRTHIAALAEERDEANRRASSAEEQRSASAAESEALRAHIAALAEERDEANRRASSAEEQRLASAAESEALRAHIAALAEERDDIAGTLHSTQVVLATHNAAIEFDAGRDRIDARRRRARRARSAGARCGGGCHASRDRIDARRRRARRARSAGARCGVTERSGHM